MKASVPAISKTLMSQTKDYRLDIKKTIVKTYIRSECKFRTDLHTHMNANLRPDILIALGIARASLAIMKDGQAVFTNLEKVYLYRYVFTKGTSISDKINIQEEMIRSGSRMTISGKVSCRCWQTGRIRRMPAIPSFRTSCSGSPGAAAARA